MSAMSGPDCATAAAIVGSRVEAQVPSVPLVALACVSADEAIVPRGGRLRLSC